MTPNEARKLWIDALRSGEYLQTTGTLRRNTSDGPRYCCLGVACEVYQKHVGDLEVKPSIFGQMTNFDEQSSILPVKVQAWLDMNSHGSFELQEGDKQPAWVKDMNRKRTHSFLTEQNDQCGATFVDIANIIETHVFRGPNEPISDIAAELAKVAAPV